jgi:predicted transcriptional regulator
VSLDHDIGPLQMRILGIWEDNEGLTVADVQARLEKSGHKAAYTTVMTVLGRLHDKGMVRRERDGRRFVYRPGKRTAQTKHRFLQRVHRALFNDDKLRPIAAMVDGELTRAELEELRKLIDAKLGERDD